MKQLTLARIQRCFGVLMLAGAIPAPHADVAAVVDLLLRHIKISHRTALLPQQDLPPAPWQISRADTAGQFSAVAYHFARR